MAGDGTNSKVGGAGTCPSTIPGSPVFVLCEVRKRAEGRTTLGCRSMSVRQNSLSCSGLTLLTKSRGSAGTWEHGKAEGGGGGGQWPRGMA